MDAPHAMMFVAAGAAIMSEEGAVPLASLCTKAAEDAAFSDTSTHGTLRRCLLQREEYAAFRQRHAAAAVSTKPLAQHKGPCYLGIDAGSTTTKAVLISDNGDVLHSFYSSNKGRPLKVIKEIISGIYNAMPDGAYIAHAASTGYGEQMSKAPHFRSISARSRRSRTIQQPRHFPAPIQTFILDIGGQDMKCLRIKATA